MATITTVGIIVAAIRRKRYENRQRQRQRISGEQFHRVRRRQMDAEVRPLTSVMILGSKTGGGRRGEWNLVKAGGLHGMEIDADNVCVVNRTLSDLSRVQFATRIRPSV